MSAADLVKLRRAMGLSIPDFADRIGASKSSVYNWEAGKAVQSLAVRRRLQELAAEHLGHGNRRRRKKPA